jgi:small subunit ribosomal protein S6
MRRYETTFILSPELEETELEKNISRYSEIITSRGGTVEKEDRWGMRRLAYMIRKKTQGYYVQLVHESGPEVPRELERQFLLNENCLRYLTVLAQKPVPEELKKKSFDPELETIADDADDDNDDDDRPGRDGRPRRSANRPSTRYGFDNSGIDNE